MVTPKKYDLSITISGLAPITSFSFNNTNNQLAYKTLITQEMMAKGYLAGTVIFTCTEHTDEIIDGYFNALDPVFSVISECEKGRDVNSLLKGPICHSGFKRLT